LGSPRQIAAFGFLFLWAIGLLSLVRHYSGGAWAGDWIEHYERTLFFLDHRPKDTVSIGAYLLPARPPLMNLVAAHCLAQVGRQYVPRSAAKAAAGSSHHVQ
jgi:hypothetical protein